MGNCVFTVRMNVFVFFARPLNLADACILRLSQAQEEQHNGSVCQIEHLLTYKMVQQPLPTKLLFLGSSSRHLH